MQACVHALIGVYVQFHRFGLQAFTAGRFLTLGICPDHIILFARGNVLGEFTIMIGI